MRINRTIKFTNSVKILQLCFILFYIVVMLIAYVFYIYLCNYYPKYLCRYEWQNILLIKYVSFTRKCKINADGFQQDRVQN